MSSEGLGEIKRISSSGRDQLVPAKAACGQAIAFLDHRQEWNNYNFNKVKILTIIRQKNFNCIFTKLFQIMQNTGKLAIC